MPVQNIHAQVLIDGRTFHVESIDHVNDAYNTAGKVTLSLSTTASVTDIADAGTVALNLMGGRRVFTGFADEVKSTGPTSIEVTAFDAVKKLKNTLLDVTYEDATFSNVLEDIGDRAGVDVIVDVPPRDEDQAVLESEGAGGAGASTNIGVADEDRENDPEVTGEPSGSFTRAGEEEGSVTVEFANQNGAQAMDHMAEEANAVWYTSVYGDIVVATSPNTRIHTLTTDRPNPRGVVDTSAGKTEPPYQSVYVFGDSAVNNDLFGRAHTHIIATNAISASAGSGTPVYTIQSNNIYTEEEAQNIADAVYNQLQIQQQGGWVACLGAPEITLFDVIEMPEHLGGERYAVMGVEHFIDDQEGFTTTIQCGGLI